MSAAAGVVSVLMWVLACGAAERSVSPVAASQTDVLTVAEVRAKREDLLGQTVRVRGQVYIQQHFSRRPCNQVTGEGCDPLIGTEVKLVTPERPPIGDDAIDVYLAKGAAEHEPLPCKPLPSGVFQCGGFTAGTIAVVTGELRRQRVVTGQIVHPDGTSTPTEFRDVYFLVLQQ